MEDDTTFEETVQMFMALAVGQEEHRVDGQRLAEHMMESPDGEASGGARLHAIVLYQATVLRLMHASLRPACAEYIKRMALHIAGAEEDE